MPFMRQVIELLRPSHGRSLNLLYMAALNFKSTELESISKNAYRNEGQKNGRCQLTARGKKKMEKIHKANQIFTTAPPSFPIFKAYS